jgi:stress response protein YsnF
MSQMTLEQISAAQGAPVYAQDGGKIGEVEEIFYDAQSGQPEWIGIGTGFFGTKRVLVPVQGGRLEPDGLYVPYSEDQVKDSPDIDGDEISDSTEQELYAYYGRGGAGQAADDDSGAAMTRSEEELRVGRRTAETGSVRLSKWVETEDVSEDVELRQERARVTREPVNQPVSEGAIGEQEVDVTLRGEQAVVDKETVAKERIGVEKDVDVQRETVSGEVRKERVEVEGDADDDRKG